MAIQHHDTLYTQHAQEHSDIDTEARNVEQSSRDNTTSKRVSTHHTGPTATRWRRIMASRPQSYSSSGIDTQSHLRETETIAQKQNPTFGEAKWPTKTSIIADLKVETPQPAATGIHRRLCFSLDEKALFDLHHPQYSSNASQKQSSSEQSPQRMSLEPIKPPFAPPERMKTPDGVPSWPGVMESRAHGVQHGPGYRTVRTNQRRLVRIFSRMLAPLGDNRNSKRSRLRRALGLKRTRQEQRPMAHWRPPVSGHSTFRFST